MSATKVEHKAVYDLAKKELKNRTEVKLDSGVKVCCSIQSRYTPSASEHAAVDHLRPLRYCRLD